MQYPQPVEIEHLDICSLNEIGPLQIYKQWTLSLNSKEVYKQS